MRTAIAREIKRLDLNETVTFYSPESQTFRKTSDRMREGIRFSPDICMASLSQSHLYANFLGSSSSKGGLWQLLHPTSHSLSFPKDCLKQVLENTQINSDAIDIQTFVDYLDQQIGQSQHAEVSYFSRYEKAFSNLPDRCTVYLEGYSSLGAFTCKNFPVASPDQKIVVRFHESIPGNLHRSRIGRELLRRISQANTILVCTDYHRDSLALQLQSCKLTIPNIVAHKFGIDFDRIKESTLGITQDNYKLLIPEFADLEPTQKDLLRDVFETRGVVPNRFYIGDGADPIKGLYQVLEGVKTFLDGQYLSLEELKTTYRFYLTQYNSRSTNDDGAASACFNTSYRQKCFELRDELVRKYPGVVVASNAFRGPTAVAVYAIMPYCHFLSGSLEDSLHLMCQEAAYANYLHATNCMISVGNGAGFSRQVYSDRGSHLGYFIDSNRSANIANTIRTISKFTLSSSYPVGRVLNDELVKSHILTRKDSLFNY